MRVLPCLTDNTKKTSFGCDGEEDRDQDMSQTWEHTKSSDIASFTGMWIL